MIQGHSLPVRGQGDVKVILASCRAASNASASGGDLHREDQREEGAAEVMLPCCVLGKLLVATEAHLIQWALATAPRPRGRSVAHWPPRPP